MFSLRIIVFRRLWYYIQLYFTIVYGSLTQNK